MRRSLRQAAANTYPRAIEREYAVLLVQRAQDVQSVVEAAQRGELLDDTLPVLHQDSLSEYTSLATRAAQAWVLARVAVSVDTLRRVGAQLDTYTRQWAAQRIHDIGGRAVVGRKSSDTAWAPTQVDAVRAVDQQLFDDLLVSNTAPNTAFLRMRNRVRFLAHNSVAAKFRAVAFEEFQLAGYDKYTWCTCQDDKVRPVHRELDGRVFLLSEPHPTEGFPGHAPNCRCVGAPCVDAFSTPG